MGCENGFVTLGDCWFHHNRNCCSCFYEKSMERKVALIIGGKESKQVSTKPVVWWIMGATVWGVVSIFLIVWSFSI